MTSWARAIAATTIENEASLRAFTKAGFRSDREFDDVIGGRCVLMVRDRWMEDRVDMTQLSERFWEVFFEVYEALPRQGPGSRACAAKALELCEDLPPTPTVLDLGCGTGGQTLDLAELTSGFITAVDRHAPSIGRLEATVAERGLQHRIRPTVCDMAHPSRTRRAEPTANDRPRARGARGAPGVRTLETK